MTVSKLCYKPTIQKIQENIFLFLRQFVMKNIFMERVRCLCLIIFARFLAQCENNSLAKLVLGRIRFSDIQSFEVTMTL